MVCSKTKHTKAEALLALKHRERKGAGTLRVYECRQCSAWHLTHTELRPQRRVSHAEKAVLGRLAAYIEQIEREREQG